MNSKHTPGPWTASLPEDRLSDAAISARTPIYKNIANIARVYRRDSERQRDADARLIAAAPDLLAALDELLADKYLSDPINADRMAAARAAIRKARGEA